MAAGLIIGSRGTVLPVTIKSAFRAAIFVASIAAHVSAQPAATPIEPKLIESTVESLAQVIRQEYFDVAVAAKVEQALRTASAEGRYASAATREALAQRLTGDLFGVTHDKHLTVAVTRPPGVKPRGGGPARDRRDQPTTAGFRHVEILAGNVGYLDLTMFLRPVEHRDALAAAMQTLRTADALILDMRDNGGGSSATVALLIRYLFDQLLLQERQRAEVVGEKTAGAANPGRPYPVNDVFEVTVPNATFAVPSSTATGKETA